MKQAPNNNILKLKFIPTPGMAILFFVLLILAFCAFAGRSYAAFQWNFFPFNLPEFYSHISNFVISYLIVAVIAMMWTLQGIPLKFVMIAGVVVIVVNIIVELFVTVLNTPDKIDAVYGGAGVILALLFGLVLKTKGTKPYIEPAAV